MDLSTRFFSREDYHQSTAYAHVMETIGWSVIPIGGAHIFIRQIGPISFAKMQRPQVVNFRKLRELQTRLRIVHTIIEPKQDIDVELNSHGYSQSARRYSYTKTAILDIARKFDTIVTALPSKTRYNYRIAIRPHTSYDSVPFHSLSQFDRDEFFALHDSWSRERRVVGFSNTFLREVMDSFQNSGWLIKAYTNGEFSGALILLIHDRIGYYFYTFSTPKGRQMHVPTGLTMEAILQSKLHGADIFDFCSMYDERFPGDNPRWRGFSEFKSRFDPQEIYFPASFSRWL